MVLTCGGVWEPFRSVWCDLWGVDFHWMVALLLGGGVLGEPLPLEIALVEGVCVNWELSGLLGVDNLGYVVQGREFFGGSVMERSSGSGCLGQVDPVCDSAVGRVGRAGAEYVVVPRS